MFLHERDRRFDQPTFRSLLQRPVPDLLRRHGEEIEDDQAFLEVARVRKTRNDRGDHPCVRDGFVIKARSEFFDVFGSKLRSDGRRRFLDAALCQLYPGYLAIYRRYVRILQQKNSLLRRSPARPERPLREKLDLPEVLNEELVPCGEEIQARRREYLGLLAPMAAENYRALSRGAEQLGIGYEAQFEPGGLAGLLAARRDEELRAGQSLCGPHREDLAFCLDGQPARSFASQGQQRSVVLSLKMAEADASARITGERPVLLLDDVLSELDEGRRAYLLTRMRERQTFVTSCDDAALLHTDGVICRMEGGVLTTL